MGITLSRGTEAMAVRLAGLRGQAVDEVVAAALRAELARAPRPAASFAPRSLTAAQHAQVDRILALVRSAAREDGPAAAPSTDWLYDDQGVPI